MKDHFIMDGIKGKKMAKPFFETTQYICDDCLVMDTPYRHYRSGRPLWYTNRDKGHGWLCKKCYNRRYGKNWSKKNKFVRRCA